MEQHRMLRSGDRVLVGVSGGADSVCLLLLLAGYRERIPFEMAVVHVHHGIRTDADEDAAYVKSLCERLGLPFFQENADVRRLAGEEGISEEEAGRRTRFWAFERYAAEWAEKRQSREVAASECPGEGQSCETAALERTEAEHNREVPAGDPGVKLALAHHMGDRAETLLFHLFRGTGSKGLASIQPVREHGGGKMTVIRPLLCLERWEIEEFLESRDIAYRTDSTNQEDGYARNRIRHHILPYAERELCQGSVRHINEAADRLSEIEEYLAQQTAMARETCVSEKGDAFGEREILAEVFLEQPPLIQKRILLEQLLELSPVHKDISAVHVEMLRGLFWNGTGKCVSLPCGIRAERVYEKVLLERQPGGESGSDSIIGLGGKPVCSPEGGYGSEPVSTGINRTVLEISLSEDPQDDWRTEENFCGSRFQFEFLKKYKIEEMPKNQYTKWFDYDKIKGTLSIRTRRTGDYLMIRDGRGGLIRKKIKDFMITEKMPREQRDSLPLLTQGDHVLWIPGYRSSEAYGPDEDTSRILQVVFRKNGG